MDGKNLPRFFHMDKFPHQQINDLTFLKMGMKQSVVVYHVVSVFLQIEYSTNKYHLYSEVMEKFLM